MPLFEIAVLLPPTKKEAEEGAIEQLVFGPECIVAKDDKAAGFKIAAKCANKIEAKDQDRVQILIRPFA